MIKPGFEIIELVDMYDGEELDICSLKEQPLILKAISETENASSISERVLQFKTPTPVRCWCINYNNPETEDYEDHLKITFKNGKEVIIPCATALEKHKHLMLWNFYLQNGYWQGLSGDEIEADDIMDPIF